MAISIGKLTAGVLVALLVCSGAAFAENPIIEATPEDVTDGDTILIELRSRSVDAPESRQQCEDAEGSCYPCGQKAEAALLELVSYYDGNDRLRYRRMEVEIWETDRFGRPVVTAYIDGKDIHLEMLRQGWMVVFHQFLSERLRESYLAAEAEAREAKRGVWQGDFIEPRLWRRGREHRLPCELE